METITIALVLNFDIRNNNNDNNDNNNEQQKFNIIEPFIITLQS